MTKRTGRPKGRPKGSTSSPNPYVALVGVRLTAGQAEALEIAAARHCGEDRSELMRQALYSFILSQGPADARALIVREMMSAAEQD